MLEKRIFTVLILLFLTLMGVCAYQTSAFDNVLYEIAFMGWSAMFFTRSLVILVVCLIGGEERIGWWPVLADMLLCITLFKICEHIRLEDTEPFFTGLGALAIFMINIPCPFVLLIVDCVDYFHRKKKREK